MTNEPWNDNKFGDGPGSEYYVCAGEGTGPGTWHTCATDSRGILAHLTLERCNGDRWSFALTDVYETADGTYAGHDVETGEPRTIPADIVEDAE